MLMLIPTLEGEFKVPVTVLGVRWQEDGALSRRQPGAAKHGFGETVGSMNRSYRTEVTSTPHLLFRPWVAVTPVLHPAGVTRERAVHVGSDRMVWAAPFVTV